MGLIEWDDQYSSSCSNRVDNVKLYVSFESCYLLVCFDKAYTTLHFPTYVGHTE